MLPFPGGIEDPSNGAVLFSLGAAILYFYMLDSGPSLLRSAVKTFGLALLAALAAMQGQPVLLVAALALSALGDYFLSRDGEAAFLAGLGSFLAAHIAYIALFWLAGEGLGLFASDTWRVGLAVAMVAFSVVMLMRLRRAVGRDLRVPVAVYVCAILLMGLTALSMQTRWVIVGALAFMASDAILATEKFLVPATSPARGWMRYAVWGLYYAAQSLILFGFLAR